MKVRIEELILDSITQKSEWTSVYEVETEHNCDVQEELEFFLMRFGVLLRMCAL